LFPNAFLFFNGDPNQCCVLGFHSFDFGPGDASNGNLLKFFVLNYSAWISPGLFGGFTDITALSHEIAETFNDPFVAFDGIHNVTPFWEKSRRPMSGRDGSRRRDRGFAKSDLSDHDERIHLSPADRGPVAVVRIQGQFLRAQRCLQLPQ
jgi:hypothetical protein